MSRRAALQLATVRARVAGAPGGGDTGNPARPACGPGRTAIPHKIYGAAPMAAVRTQAITARRPRGPQCVGRPQRAALEASVRSDAAAAHGSEGQGSSEQGGTEAAARRSWHRRWQRAAARRSRTERPRQCAREAAHSRTLYYATRCSSTCRQVGRQPRLPNTWARNIQTRHWRLTLNRDNLRVVTVQYSHGLYHRRFGRCPPRRRLGTGSESRWPCRLSPGSARKLDRLGELEGTESQGWADAAGLLGPLRLPSLSPSRTPGLGPGSAEPGSAAGRLSGSAPG